MACEGDPGVRVHQFALYVRACCVCPPRTSVFEHTPEKRASRNGKRGVSRMGMCASVVRAGTDCETRPGRSPVCVCCAAIVLFMRRLLWWSSGLRPTDGRPAGPSRRICSCQKNEVFTLRYCRFVTVLRKFLYVRKHGLWARGAESYGSGTYNRVLNDLRPTGESAPLPPFLSPPPFPPFFSPLPQTTRTDAVCGRGGGLVAVWRSPELAGRAVRGR